MGPTATSDAWLFTEGQASTLAINLTLFTSIQRMLHLHNPRGVTFLRGHQTPRVRKAVAASRPGRESQQTVFHIHFIYMKYEYESRLNTVTRGNLYTRRRHL